MADRVLAFLYARLGPSILCLVPVWGALVGLGIFAVVASGTAHLLHADPWTVLLAFGGWLVVCGLIAVQVMWRARQDLAPVLAWADAPRTPEQAADTCRALVHPKRAARRFSLVLIALTPLQAASITVILAQPWWFVPPALVTAVAAMGGMATALTAATDVLQQPLRDDVFGHLPPGFEMVERRTPLALQPVVLTPIPVLQTALIVGVFGDVADGGVGRFAVAAGIGVVIVAGISLVVAVRAMAWVTPIKGLSAAAQRVQAGDLSASVPVVSNDETGTLAHHFNEMLVGLREREELRTDLVAREAELRASRDRIITAADAERRRVERNLHDGAQQRLVALQLDLRLLEDAAADADRPELAEQAAEAREALKGALAELRDLARGLHPTVLDSDGLAPAIRQLTDRSPVPVDVDVDVGRLPTPVESTLYFVVSEALANVAKHARATAATVRIDTVDGDVRLQVTDDGVGGAHAPAGSGMSGLADRVDAAGGTLRIVSPPGAGTTVMVAIPVAVPVPVGGAPR
ncbi:MAG: sensor histidine kinase [Solirubrobacteraceae bacterium]|nr:sensor histidine kinase [Solirubrobacteraceae bacterium]